MPTVEFYVLQAGTGAKSLHFACQLLEKAYQNLCTVFVHTDSREQAYQLDDLLWTFQEDSFIPHQVGNEGAPILIGYHCAPPANCHTLLNLGRHVPDFYRQFQQIMEIVFPDPVVQQLARERYKYYRDNGLQINTHKS